MGRVAHLIEAFDEQCTVDDSLRAQGLIDDNGLTPAGELRLLQLKLLKHMAEKPPDVRAEKRRKRKGRHA